MHKTCVMPLLALMLAACGHRPAPMGQLLLPHNQGRVLDVGPQPIDAAGGTVAASCARLRYTQALWQARFEGPEVAIKLRCAASDGPCVGPLTVEVDGVAQAPVPAPGAAAAWVTLARGLGAGRHTVVLRRTAEAQLGEVELCGVQAVGGRLLPPPRPAPRQLLVLGDSISAGYGNLCPGLTGFDAMALEDGGKTYGALAARALGAEARIMAWSGIGLWRNGDGSFDHTLPKRWHALWGDAPAPKGQLDAIVINLGTNDFRREGLDDAAFIAAYVAFIEDLHQSYPMAHFFLGVGPMLSATDPAPSPQQPHALALVRAVAEHSSTGELALEGRVHVVTFATQDGSLGFGCAYHPNLATHAQMAATLGDALHDVLGWSRF